MFNFARVHPYLKKHTHNDRRIHKARKSLVCEREREKRNGEVLSRNPSTELDTEPKITLYWTHSLIFYIRET